MQWARPGLKLHPCLNIISGSGLIPQPEEREERRAIDSRHTPSFTSHPSLCPSVPLQRSLLTACTSNKHIMHKQWQAAAQEGCKLLPVFIHRAVFCLLIGIAFSRIFDGTTKKRPQMALPLSYTGTWMWTVIRLCHSLPLSASVCVEADLMYYGVYVRKVVCNFSPFYLALPEYSWKRHLASHAAADWGLTDSIVKSNFSLVDTLCVYLCATFGSVC